jgi:uncharacterized protein (TIGR02391 family)
VVEQFRSIEKHAASLHNHLTQVNYVPSQNQEEIISLVRDYINAKEDFDTIRCNLKLDVHLDSINCIFFDSYNINKVKALLSEIAKRSNKAIGILEGIAFWSIIHRDIIEVAKDKFEDGHYADAVESAFKEINNRVKKIVKKKMGDELDGAALMRRAFSENNPVIELDNLSSTTGKDVQKGYMDIFAGAMTGIRNPKAHANIRISKERAIHFIFLASLLMDKLDEALGER